MVFCNGKRKRYPLCHSFRPHSLSNRSLNSILLERRSLQIRNKSQQIIAQYHTFPTRLYTVRSTQCHWTWSKLLMTPVAFSPQKMSVYLESYIVRIRNFKRFCYVVQKYVNMLHFTSTNQHVQPLNHSVLCKLIFAHAVMIVVTLANAQAATPSWWCGLIRTTCTPHADSQKVVQQQILCMALVLYWDWSVQNIALRSLTPINMTGPSRLVAGFKPI